MTSKRMYETRLANNSCLLSPKTVPTPKAASMPTTPKARTDVKLKRVALGVPTTISSLPTSARKSRRAAKSLISEDLAADLYEKYNHIVHEVFWKAPEVTYRQRYQNSIRDADNYYNTVAKRKVMQEMKPKEYYDLETII